MIPPFNDPKSCDNIRGYSERVLKPRYNNDPPTASNVTRTSKLCAPALRESSGCNQSMTGLYHDGVPLPVESGGVTGAAVVPGAGVDPPGPGVACVGSVTFNAPDSAPAKGTGNVGVHGVPKPAFPVNEDHSPVGVPNCWSVGAFTRCASCTTCTRSMPTRQ